jgi:hypothetical protein
MVALGRHLFLCFVIGYPNQLCVYRPRKVAKKRDKREMMTAEEGPVPKATRGRVRTPKTFAK